MIKTWAWACPKPKPILVWGREGIRFRRRLTMETQAQKKIYLHYNHTDPCRFARWNARYFRNLNFISHSLSFSYQLALFFIFQLFLNINRVNLIFIFFKIKKIKGKLWIHGSKALARSEWILFKCSEWALITVRFVWDSGGFLFFYLYYFHNLYLYLFACDVYMLFFLNCICFCISYTRLMMLLPTFLIYVIFLNVSITQLSLVSHNGVVEATRKQTQTQTQTRCFLNEILESTRW